MRESAAASHIRLDAAYLGVDLWRNNNGAFEDKTGRWVRYGLCNDSAALAKLVKSSEVIGIPLDKIKIVEKILGREVANNQKALLYVLLLAVFLLLNAITQLSTL